MTDLLSIAASGVRAYARALETVGDNVANAATPGHVRRTIALSPAGPQGGNGPLELDPPGGNGVRLTAIDRAGDLLQADAVRRADGLVAALSTAEEWMARLESSVTGPASLDPPIADFFAGLADLSADPASLPVRATVLARADAMAARFRDAADDLDRAANDLARAADVEARALNGLTQSLASLNAQLRRATPGGGSAAALADERDRLVGRIAGFVAIEVRYDVRGQASVRVPDSGGPLLVDGADAQSVRLEPAGTGFELRVGAQGADELAAPGSGSMTGLSLAAQRLAAARTGLDGLANRLATELNAAHRAGVTLTGADGRDLFATVRMEATPAAANGGNARVRAVLADGTLPVPLRLVHDGVTGDWTLARPDGSASITGALPLTLDGVTITGEGRAANGDVFQVIPRSGAAGLSLGALAPADLAAASRFLGEASPANVGTGRLELQPGPPLLPPAAPPFALAVAPGGTVELRDGLGALLASGLPGDWLAGDGFAARLSAGAAEGDGFAIRRTPADSASAGNALALLAVRDLAGAPGTIADQGDRIVTGLAVPLADTRLRLEAGRAERDRLAEAWQQASGVDLNQEATEMLRFQQAYQANARIIETARATFEALLSAVR